MKRDFLAATVASATIAAVTIVGGIAAGARQGMPARARVVRSEADGPTPILVELFTSEGCSDCPAADTVLADLSKNQPIARAHVIALGEHVDYWNRQGWTDPFSSAAFSLRQGDYATTFHNAQVYTPQMVVEGHAEFVGSDSDRARAEIRGAATAMAHATTHVSLEARSAGSDKVAVTVEVRGLPQTANRADVYLALTEDDLSSQVKGGENRGRHLNHTAVVRSLERIGTTPASGGDATLTATLPLAHSASLSNLHAVAFVQSAGPHDVLGAADVALRGLEM